MSEEASLDEFAGQDDNPDEDKGGDTHPRFGRIPPHWRIEELAQIAEVVGGSTPSTSNESYWDGGIPWATPTDLTNLSGNTIKQTADTLTQEGLDSASTHLLPSGSVLMTSRATIGECAVNETEMATNQGFKSLVPGEGINTWYLHYQMLDTAEYLKSLGSGSTFDEVSKSTVQSVDVPLPPLPEQRKIATVLHTVDRAIEKTEEIVSQQRRVKRGLYQYLFSKGYKNYSDFKSSKYGDIPKSWGISKLSEVTSQIQAGGTPNTDVSEYYDGDIPWVKTGELSQYRVTEAEESITQKGYEESTARLFSPGTVLIAMYGATTGEVSLLGIEATTNQACCGVVTTEEIDSEFLFHQLNHFSNRLESLSAGSGQQNISKGIIEKFDVLVPPVEEQASIVEVLSSVDQSIKENQVVNSHYKRLKRGLMQDLLSGEVRTTDKSIEVPDEISQHG